MAELTVKNEEVAKIAKALASQTRWEILRLLREKKMDVSRIAETLKQTEANVSAQVKILEKAGLLKSHYEPGEHEGALSTCG
ncbi:MAG: ArsR/SmtB family transcription factor [Candidatus Freyarchaeota archaeon]|nr:metalloregulator ArsR/SmtB family transcription factor [Candidatus Freyarchaeota archaeon]